MQVCFECAPSAMNFHLDTAKFRGFATDQRKHLAQARALWLNTTTWQQTERNMFANLCPQQGFRNA